jgi:hypothetical protein
LLGGPKTGPQGVHQIQTETLANRGDILHEHRNGAADPDKSNGRVRLYSRLKQKEMTVGFFYEDRTAWLLEIGQKLRVAYDDEPVPTAGALVAAITATLL